MTERFIDIKVRTGNSKSEIKSLDVEVKKLSTDTDKVTQSNKNLVTSNTQLTKSAKGVKSGIAGIGRGAGQAGIQVQQFIGQIQGGQSAMLALSQQSADLGFVLGAPLVGAVVGISASLLGMAASINSTKIEVKSLEESTKSLVDEYDKLTKAQQAITKSTLVERFKERKKEANALQVEINELTTSLITAQRAAASGKFLDSLFGGDPAKARADLVAAQGSLSLLNLELQEIDKTLKNLDTLDVSDATKKIDQQRDAINSIIISANNLANTYGNTARELAIYEARLLGANDAQVAAIDISFDRIDALKQEEDALKASAKASSFNEKLSQETSALRNEIATRQMISQGAITQQEANLVISFENKAAIQEVAFQAELEKLGVDDEIRAALLLSFDEKRVADKELLEQRLTDISDDGASKRVGIEEAYSKQVTSMQLGVAQNAVSLISQLVGDSKAGAIALIAVQKGLAIGETIINSQVAATRALAELGPILGPPAAAKMLAYGKVSAGLIAATGIAQASGGGGGSAPSISSPASAAAPSQDVPTEAINQTRVIDLRTDGSAFSLAVAEATKSVLQNDETVVVSITEAQQELVRVGGA